MHLATVCFSGLACICRRKIFVILWPCTLTFDNGLRTSDTKGQGEPTCQIFGPNVILLERYMSTRTHARTHTHTPGDWEHWDYRTGHWTCQSGRWRVAFNITTSTSKDCVCFVSNMKLLTIQLTLVTLSAEQCKQYAKCLRLPPQSSRLFLATIKIP